jgi:alpha-L-arabinofuranosidase
MIWVDNLRIYGTPNYYVQKLFSVNKGTNVVSLLENEKTLSGQDSLYASAVIDKKTNELIVKIVNVSGQPKSRDIQIDGVRKLSENAAITVLKANELGDMNSFTDPTKVAPVEQAFKIKSKKVSLPLAPYSFTVLRIKML